MGNKIDLIKFYKEPPFFGGFFVKSEFQPSTTFQPAVFITASPKFIRSFGKLFLGFISN